MNSECCISSYSLYLDNTNIILVRHQYHAPKHNALKTQIKNLQLDSGYILIFFAR